MVFDDKANFSCRLLSTDRQVASLCNTFANNSSANKNFSKTLLTKTKLSADFLGVLLGPLMKADLPLMKNIL